MLQLLLSLLDDKVVNSAI